MCTFNLHNTLNYGFPQYETGIYQHDPHKTQWGCNDESTTPQKLDLDLKRKGISEIINGLWIIHSVYSTKLIFLNFLTSEIKLENPAKTHQKFCWKCIFMLDAYEYG